MSTSLATLRNKADTVVEAIRQLEQAKEAIQIEKLLVDTDVLLVQERKERLQSEVDALTEEKMHLQSEVSIAKKQLEGLIGNASHSKTNHPTDIEVEENDIISDDEWMGTFPVGPDSQESTLGTQDMFSLLDEETSVGTQSSFVSTTTSSTKRKKLHHKATSRSPKKWRRMIRSHRLQSIFLTN